MASVRADANARLLSEFRRRQAEMYSGGDVEPVAGLLAGDVVWHVPGRSRIAGDHSGRDAVLRYFDQRRALAEYSMCIEVRESYAGEEGVVELADGRARLGGAEADWTTVGLYRVRDGQIAEASLVPLDLDGFDRVWCRTRRPAFVHTVRIRAQETGDGAVLGHPRLLEHLEAAFIETWRAQCGSLREYLGSGCRLTIASLQVDCLAPVRFDDVLRIEVAIDARGRSSLVIHYRATVDEAVAADGRVVYVCVDAETGEPREL